MNETFNFQVIKEVCGISISPLTYVIIPIGLDFVLLWIVASSVSSSVKWYHHAIFLKNVVALWMALVAVCTLWHRGLSGTHLFACSTILEVEISSIPKLFSVFAFFVRFLPTVDTDRPEFATTCSACIGALTMLPLFVFLAHIAIVGVGSFAIMWPFAWISFGWMIITICIAACGARGTGLSGSFLQVLLESASNQNYYDEERQEMDMTQITSMFHMASVSFKWISVVFSMFAIAELAGLLYYGWLVEQSSYTTALQFMWNDRPGVREYTIHQFQNIINWL